jgi:hypothetical protein
MRERRNEYGDMVGMPEGKRKLGNSRHSWEDHIKKNLR